MEYQYETTSITGFVQRVATHLLTHGYYFFVQGQIPPGKDPRALDQKLLHEYDIKKTERQRSFRKEKGLGNVQYIRFENTWLLLATHGEHPMKERERTNLRDAREVPIQIGGYSIYVKRGDYLRRLEGDTARRVDGRYRVRVLISRNTYRELLSYFLDKACHRSAETLAAELWNLPFEPYAPVRKQLLKLLRLLNKKRKLAGYSKIPTSVFRFKRRIVKAFEPIEEKQAA